MTKAPVWTLSGETSSFMNMALVRFGEEAADVTRKGSTRDLLVSELNESMGILPTGNWIQNGAGYPNQTQGSGLFWDHCQHRHQTVTLSKDFQYNKPVRLG